MNQSCIYSALFAVVLTATFAACAETAQAEFNISCLCDKCPSCDCSLEAEMVNVEKSCFEVERKTICIPRVVFPWQHKKSRGSCDSCDGRGCTSCVNNGAKTRCISVLKKKKYTCAECKYTWTANTGSCCDGGCATVENNKKSATKVVNNQVALPPTWEPGRVPFAGRVQHSTSSGIQPVQIETRSPWSTFRR